ncbi:hypothetical protein CPC08DRAFT_700018 [Agrocybe pediades]|nr:hypothetical protein CPC08DRAFT_700018 [Agrocybe pediades]
MSTRITTTISSVSNKLKPHKAEAFQRIRINAACLVTTLVISYLLPLPSIPSALKLLVFSARAHGHPASWSAEWIWERVCFLEMGLVSLWMYNIVEALYAIKYPRTPLPAVTSPAAKKTLKSAIPASTSTTPKRAFKILSPNTSPQPQRPFAPSSSLSSVSMALHSLSASTGSGYPPSPVSTPSRVLHYNTPLSSSTGTASILNASSTSSNYLDTPSPVISAYRGKHIGGDVGRALDGSYLSRIMQEEEDSRDD